MATVKINEKLVSIIKDKRKKKKLTQKDMAEYLQETAESENETLPPFQIIKDLKQINMNLMTKTY